MHSDFTIETRDLTKEYPEVRAVDGLELRVRRGELYGFLGRNGAGKTTTIRMLTGLISPTKGVVRLFGEPLRPSGPVLGRIGSLVETAVSYPNLSVRENLELQRRYLRASQSSTARALGLLGLEEYADRRAGRLSLGNKQRLALARALVGSPEILFLDEPANGLDPAGIVEIRALLRRLADEDGMTIFMSSHNLPEVDQLADRIGIIHRGRLVEELSREQLEQSSKDRLELEVDDPVRAGRILSADLGYSGVELLDGGRISVTDPVAAPERAAATLIGAGIGLKRLGTIKENLESHFMRLTGGAE